MSFCSTHLRRIVPLACLTVASFMVQAQESPKPAAKPATDASASRWDLFLGYSYLAPHGTVNGYKFNAINYGTIGSVTRYFNKYVGVQGEGDVHSLSPENGVITKTQPNNDFSGGSLGLIFRNPTSEVTPFVHALVGGERVGTYNLPEVWGVVLTAGGGMDYATPFFDHRLAVRVFQADYQYTHENFDVGERGNFKNVRLSAGLVWHIGSIAPPAPPTIACSASPTSVFPGDPVSVTATASGLNPKENAVYDWSGQGVSGNGTTVSIATANLAPGSYTVKCGVKEGKPGKEGEKPWQSADNSTGFTVREFGPPSISCSASPTTIKPGETVTITATGTSPQNRPLTYNYSAQEGTVSGTGATATYNSAGAQPGTVNITCNVADDKGHTASSTTSLAIEVPPPPPGPSLAQQQLEQRLALHSVFFPTAQPTSKHPDGGLVESQQATLSTLAKDFKQYLEFKPEARLTLTGHADVRGSVELNQALSDRRVARVKSFLVQNGVPEASIETRGVGKEQELSAEQVREMVDKNTTLTDGERKRMLRQMRAIVLAQNRRVDIRMDTTGQESVKQFPFNASDAFTLLDEKSTVSAKKVSKKK